MTLESGKPIRDALVEVDRAVITFRLGAEEAERMTGELIPLDIAASSKGRIGITRRFPIGPVAAISPFNFPLNLAAHKVAPAIAAGCSIVLKPPSKDPLTMLAVAEIVERAGVPEGAISDPAHDPRAGRPDGRRRALQAAHLHRLAVRRLAHEGARRQEEGRARAGRQRRRHRRQDRPTSTGPSSARSSGAFGYAGQVCISVQRMFVHERTSGTSSCAASSTAPGSSRWAIRSTLRRELGPMVDEAAAQRTQRWVEEARALGGRVLLGGRGRRRVLPADRAGRHAGQRAGVQQRGVRAAGRGLPVRRLRRCHRAGQRLVLRPAGGHLHQRPGRMRGARSTSSRWAA